MDPKIVSSNVEVFKPAYEDNSKNKKGSKSVVEPNTGASKVEKFDDKPSSDSSSSEVQIITESDYNATVGDSFEDDWKNYSDGFSDSEPATESPAVIEGNNLIEPPVLPMPQEPQADPVVVFTIPYVKFWCVNIHADVKEVLCPDDHNNLEEGGVFILSRFGIGNNQGKNPTVTYNFKLHLYRNTCLRKICSFDGSNNAFQCLSFSQLSAKKMSLIFQLMSLEDF
ncbi:uncharacterized protein [Rutidosis leptorrhynchoides]|uniref:uncharacterized protein n=1 Tax=Rutidosis leptorrhynchoides TaxID=125765 RepID=UPI003A990217